MKSLALIVNIHNTLDFPNIVLPNNIYKALIQSFSKIIAYNLGIPETTKIGH